MSANRPRPTIPGKELLCHFCHQGAPDTPYRVIDLTLPGARWLICSPDCKQRPEGSLIVMSEEWELAKK